MKKRILLVLLVCSFIFSICACANGGDTTDETTPAEDTTTAEAGDETTTAVVTTAPLYVEDDLKDIDLKKATVTVLYWSDVERHEFDVAGITGDRVDDAIYSRNITTEERLNVTLNWVGTPGNYNNQAAFVKACETGNADKSYDIFAGYSLTGSTIAMNGLSQNMLDLNHLNFEKPWWPASLIGQATINDKLYFASGDISTMMLHMMYGVIFNKTLLTNLGLEEDNPYELVTDNKWTLTKMMQMCENAYADVGTTPGAVDVGDQFGFVSTDINFDGFYTGCGLKSIEKTDDGLVISEDFTSQKAQDLVETLVDFFDQDYAFGNKNPSSFSPTLIFAEDRALFTMDRVYITSSANILAAGDALKYGVVPCPKYDAKQATYVTLLGFPYTLYSISSAIEDEQADAAAAVLECLGSEGYRKVTPELFETVMKVKYTSDETASSMYDLIKSCVYIDHGRIFTTELSNVTYQLFRNEVDNGTKNYQSKLRIQTALITSGLTRINEKFYAD